MILMLSKQAEVEQLPKVRSHLPRKIIVFREIHGNESHGDQTQQEYMPLLWHVTHFLWLLLIPNDKY